MIIFDVMVAALVIASAVGGYRRGAVEQVVVLLGLVAGGGLALLLAPWLWRVTSGDLARALVSGSLILVGLVVGTRVGQRAATRAGHQVRARTPRVDAIGGSVVSVTALLLATWFLAVGLSTGPFPTLAETLRRSVVVRGLKGVVPPPPFLSSIDFVSGRLGFADALAGLPPVPGDPVPPPSTSDVIAAGALGVRSSIEVLGSGCVPGKFNEGSGFVIAPGYVVTAAHVVAGTHDQFLYDGKRYPAVVVGMDTGIDAAILYAATLRRPPMSLALGQVAKGSGGAVIGFPSTSAARVTPAAVRGTIRVLGHDIYGAKVVQRRLYELQAPVQPGSSGGPFVLPDGSAAGLVVDTSVLDPAVAYAIPASELVPLMQAGEGSTEALPSGPCPGFG